MMYTKFTISYMYYACFELLICLKFVAIIYYLLQEGVVEENK